MIGQEDHVVGEFTLPHFCKKGLDRSHKQGRRDLTGTTPFSHPFLALCKY